MSALARVVLGFLSVAWIAACGGLIAMAWTPERKLDIEFSDFDLEAFIVAGDMEKWLFTALMGVLALLGLLAFLLVFHRADRAPKGAVRLKQADGGTVEVTTEALEALVAAEMLEVEDVRAATAQVRVKGNSVATSLVLGIGGNVSIANVTANAGTKLNEVFRDQVGVVDVRRPVVRIEYDGTPRRGERATPPPPPAPLAAEPAPERRLSFDRPEERPRTAATMPPPPPESTPDEPPHQTSSITLPPPPEPPAEQQRE